MNNFNEETFNKEIEGISFTLKELNEQIVEE